MRGVLTMAKGLRAGAGYGALALGVALASPAFGQGSAEAMQDGAASGAEATTSTDAVQKAADIVVTGTLVRGIAPAGTNVLNVTQEQIESLGATNTTQILQSIPQMGNFASLSSAPQPVGNQQTTNRPSLRGGLPGFNSSGGSTTLVLLDGHRIVGMGIGSTAPDPDIIPPGAMRRTEVVTDGGSAIYGSDAVAGVLNFITRKDFKGIDMDVNYGLGDHYHTVSGNVTAGHAWDGGSIYISYNYAGHGQITGRDRDYIRQPLVATGFSSPSPQAVTSLSCPQGNVLVNNQIYALPYGAGAAVAGRANQCDLSDAGILFPRERRHSVMAGLSQHLNDAISIDLQAFYTNRKTEFYGGGGSPTSATVPSSNPFFAAHQIAGETSQVVYFQVPQGSHAYGQEIDLDAYGVTGTLTARLGSNWQLRVLGAYSESLTRSQSWGFNNDALTNALAASDPNVAFNPYNPSATNAATLAAITNYGTFGRAAQGLANGRAIIDGGLFNLPGGSVKLAAGIEYSLEMYRPQSGDTVLGGQNSGYGGLAIGGYAIVPSVAPLTRYDLSRNVKSAFGELVVPIFSGINGFGGMRELTVSLAGRIDDYSDVGSTFNPKIGVTWRPIKALRLRGAWGTSFNAPSLADTAAASPTRASYTYPLAYLPFLQPPSALVANGTYPAANPYQTILVLTGNDPNIKPQTAKTYSLGFDLQPAAAPGLRLSASWWGINFKNVISTPPITVQDLMYGSYGRLFTLNPTTAQEAAAIASTQTGSATGNRCYLASDCVYAILKNYKTNLGDFRMNGIDFSADYETPTGFGSISMGAAGTYELRRESRAGANAGWVNEFNMGGETPRFRIRTYLGGKIGGFQAQAALSHRSGYGLPSPVGIPAQTSVSGFNLVDLYFRQELKGHGVLGNMSISLNIDNVFNQNPPEYRGVSSLGGLQGFINGFTVGRVFQFGLKKKI